MRDEGETHVYFFRPFFLEEIPDLLYWDVFRVGDYMLYRVGIEDFIEWLTAHP